VAIVTRKGVDVVLKIFGKGTDDYVSRLRTMASDLGIADRLEWCGFVSEQRRLYQDIDVCLVPSHVEEAFGMTALEAAFFGRPAICTSRGGLVEIVQDNVTGMLVEPDDAAALAGAIEAFARDPDRCRDMGEAARRRARQDFSNANFISGFIDVFDRLKSQQLGTDASLQIKTK
jgi:glycosyltransferase involved in cell wall biosynthesis